MKQEKTLQDESDYTLILSQAAHMDWDWLNWNKQLTTGSDCVDPGQFAATTKGNGPSNQIYNWVNRILVSDSDSYYSSCEMAFLKAFSQTYPDEFDAILQTGRLKIIGGGITSPDNLLSHGETFIRNYLIGKKWCDSVGLSWTNCLWLPDDFGHDTQLPIVLKAMNAKAVGIARVPGNCKSTMLGQKGLAHNILLDKDTGGLSFNWQASDGSTMLTHYMPDQYHQGSDINNTSASTGDFVRNTDCQVCEDRTTTDQTSMEHISNYIGCNSMVSPGNIIYVQVSNDFLLPKGTNYNEVTDYNSEIQSDELLSYYCSQWNEQDEDERLNTEVQTGTFEDYIDLLLESGANLKTRSWSGETDETKFQPTPYWMGFYASLPALKYLHKVATEAVLAAEIFERIAYTYSIDTSEILEYIADAWEALAPSTHHDYVTGTSTYKVYDSTPNEVEGEQLVLSKNALVIATLARDSALVALVDEVQDESLVVFNPIGKYRNSEVCFLKSGNDIGSLPDGIPQQEVEGGKLIYASGRFSPLSMTSTNETGNLPSEASIETTESTAVLKNAYMQVTIDLSTGNISKLTDSDGVTNYISGDANVIDIYSDDGDCYKFGYENVGGNFSSISPDFEVKKTETIEEGSLRVGLEIELKTSYLDVDYTYKLVYRLGALDRYLDISLEGQAPDFCTVVTSFPLNDAVGYLDYGTPYHWDSKEVEIYPQEGADFTSIMHATHDFIVARDSDKNALGAIFHSKAEDNYNATGSGDVPGSAMAWTNIDTELNSQNGLFGCLLRSVKDPDAVSNDKASHKVSFVFRIPDGISTDTSDGAIQYQAKCYNTPMIAYTSSGNENGVIDSEQFSLAEVSSDDENISPSITVAKSSVQDYDDSGLVLRVYNPSNTEASMTVYSKYIDKVGLDSACTISALEDTSTMNEVSLSDAKVSFDQENALTTIYLTTND